MIPLYGFLEGDTIGLLVLAQSDDSIREIAGKLQAAARLRVAIDGPVKVLYGGRTPSDDELRKMAGFVRGVDGQLPR